MDIRLALFHLARRHALDTAQTAQLQRLAGLDAMPAGLAHWLPRGVAVLGAALGGLGLIFWIAANWDDFGRFGRFALLQALFVAMAGAALLRPAARVPLALVALLAIGALFAYFGQTYQTGADPWQLFALWAALGLPLCLGTRSDVLWTPWALIVMSAISLWVHAHSGHRFNLARTDLDVHLVGWGAIALLVLALSPLARPHTGAGVWSLRAALTLASAALMAMALDGLFRSDARVWFWLGLAALGGAGALLGSARMFDVFGLSAVGLALNVLIVTGLGYAMLSGSGDAFLIALTGLGVIAAALLAATVHLILTLTRRHQAAAQVAP